METLRRAPVTFVEAHLAARAAISRVVVQTAAIASAQTLASVFVAARYDDMTFNFFKKMREVVPGDMIDLRVPSIDTITPALVISSTPPPSKFHIRLWTLELLIANEGYNKYFHNTEGYVILLASAVSLTRQVKR